MPQSIHKKNIIIDQAVPFIEGRLEPFANVQYLPTEEICGSKIADAEIIIGHTRTRYNEQTLRDTGVKLALTCTIGMDHIDVPWCKSAGIEVGNAPGCNAPAVAQYVWSSLLNCGFIPDRMTLGIVGCGHVGKIVAEWGKLLGAKLLICDPPRAQKGECPEVGGEFFDLETVLRNSDAVTMHVPLTHSGPYATHHMLSDTELAWIPSNAIVINAARGPVIETNALKRELLECRLRGVIDTWEGEPSFDRELLEYSEIGTFHIAGYSLEGKQRATRMALEHVSRRYGWDIDMTGLAEDYKGKLSISARDILASYNPYVDMALLMERPNEFDKLRAEYKYRKEV